MEAIYPKRIVGTILTNPEYWLEAQQVVATDLPPNLRPIWLEIANHYEKDILTDRAVLEALKEKGILDELGDEESKGEDFYVNILTTADEKLFQQAVDKVVDESMHISLQEVAARLMAESKNGRAGTDIIEDYITKLDAVHRNATKQLTIGTLDPGYAERMASMRRGETSTNWLPTIPALAGKVGMVDRAEFIVVAGDTGGGKSSLLRAEAINTSLGGKTVLTFDGEGNTEWYKRFCIAYLSTLNDFPGVRLDTMKLKNPSKMTDEEWKRFEELNEVLQRIPWIIEPIASVKKMEMIARQTRRRHPDLTLVQVDQVQNLIASTDMDKIETVTYQLRSMAGHLQIPVMAAHQMRKKGKEENPNSYRRPGMDDLLFAGAHAASMGILIWRQKMPEAMARMFEDNKFENGNLKSELDYGVYVIKLVIAKSSGGTTGVTDDIAWYRGTNRFDILEKDWNSANSVASAQRQQPSNTAGNRPVNLPTSLGNNRPFKSLTKQEQTADANKVPKKQQWPH